MPVTKIRNTQYNNLSGTRLSGAGTYFSEVPYVYPMIDNSAINMLFWHAGNADNQVVVTVQWGEILPGEYPHVPSDPTDISLIWRDSTLTTTVTNVTLDANQAGRVVEPDSTFARILVPVWESPFMRLKYVLSGTTPAMSIETYVRMETEE